jgi:molecular chaperone GrpE
MSGQPNSENSKAGRPDSPGTEAPAGETAVPAAEPQGATAGAAQGATAGGQDAQPLSLEQRVEQLKAQVAELTDRLLRAHAEIDNIRKRYEKEKADLAKYAISKFAGDVVPVGDNFRRAVSAVPANEDQRSETMKSLLEGVLMIEREFLNALERNGVRRIDPQGEIFNPHFHQAVMEQVNPDVPAGTIVQVFQPGYVIEDRVLRPAMVVVAKGGPKPASQNGQPQAAPPAPGPEGETGGGPTGAPGG